MCHPTASAKGCILSKSEESHRQSQTRSILPLSSSSFFSISTTSKPAHSIQVMRYHSLLSPSNLGGSFHPQPICHTCFLSACHILVIRIPYAIEYPEWMGNEELRSRNLESSPLPCSCIARHSSFVFSPPPLARWSQLISSLRFSKKHTYLSK